MWFLFPQEGRRIVSLTRSATTRPALLAGRDRAAPIAIADEIKAWGQPQADATFAVERMWVNIVNLIGPISGATTIAGGVRVQQQDRHTELHTVTIDARTIVEQDGRDHTYSSEVMQLREGERWQIIGVQLANGSVQATRLLPLV
jgi:hypothetical protein